MSSSGMLLQVERSLTFRVDELVSIEVELPDDTVKSLSSWGIARVARVEGPNVGVPLFGGTFESVDGRTV